MENVSGFNTVKSGTTIWFETLGLSSFTFFLILRSYLSLGRVFNVSCFRSKTSTYLFSFEGIQEAATHH